ncbi:unnamed protein product [Toxocara canis]|uniref:Uncharacterized protein n=1 Tax=Toxocara canis TaxID=6265 RepID=A0A3P7FDP2_TOXCA|nr:unnamed protein product [Toxocara canis]
MATFQKQTLRTTGRETILEGCPEGWSDILDIIDSCDFEAAPEYDTINSILQKAMEANAFTYEMPYDWQNGEICDLDRSHAQSN